MAASYSEAEELWRIRPEAKDQPAPPPHAGAYSLLGTVRVRFASATYIARVNGFQASCTMGSRQAAEAVCRKAWPHVQVRVRRVTEELWLAEGVQP